VYQDNRSRWGAHKEVDALSSFICAALRLRDAPPQPAKNRAILIQLEESSFVQLALVFDYVTYNGSRLSEAKQVRAKISSDVSFDI
jgi:hypothetical protein